MSMSSKDPNLVELETYLKTKRDNDQYDPHQDKEVRRKLRVKYRELEEKTHESRRELVGQDGGEGLYNAISKLNILFQDVKNTGEAVLDSKVVRYISDLNKEKVKNINIGANNEVDIDELAGRVITRAREGIEYDSHLDWEYIGKKANIYSKRVLAMDFMLGPIDVERKHIKRTKTSRLVKNKEDLVMPDKLKEGDIEKQENETSNNVNTIYSILKEKGPINYFKFVTNPESFSQTVENIFYVSFLAKNGVVSIDVQSGQPILSIHSAPQVESADDVVDKKQIIMGIDLKDFNDIISTYKITETCIPTREKKEVVASGRGWY